jgi:hypothetical protein
MGTGALCTADIGQGMISLGGGLPSSEYFPFESMDIKVPTVGKFLEEETKKTGKTMHLGKHDVREGKSAYDLSIALNYGQSSGSAQMVRWVTEHTEVRRSDCGRIATADNARLSTTLRTEIGPAHCPPAAPPPSRWSTECFSSTATT